MAKNLTNKTPKPATTLPTQQVATSKLPPNAFRDRNWGVLFISFVFVLSLVATLAVMFLTISTRLDVVPAALLMVMVEAWLVFSIPLYSKLAFWGGVIFILSFLFFAMPFLVLNLFPPYNAYTISFISISLLCFVIMFRERRLFLDKPARSKSNS